MSRIRTIKPEFFQSEPINTLTYRARLTFIGLWTYADDEGRFRFDSRVIAGTLWPLDDDVSGLEVRDDILAARVAGLVAIYRADDGKQYGAIRGWKEHQRINRPSVSRIPPPPVDNPVDNPVEGALTEDSPTAHPRKGKGKGNGGGRSEDSMNTHGEKPWCDDHPGGTTLPCRKCGAARQAYMHRPSPKISFPPTPEECDHGRVLAGHCVYCGVAMP